MNKEFIPYEQALELKELGFNEECFAYYNNLGVAYNRIKNTDTLIEAEHIKGNWCTSPLYQQAFRWFREKYRLDSFIKQTWTGTFQQDNGYSYSILQESDYDYFLDLERFTYEEAELTCLKKLIEIAKNK